VLSECGAVNVLRWIRYALIDMQELNSQRVRGGQPWQECGLDSKPIKTMMSGLLLGRRLRHSVHAQSDLLTLDHLSEGAARRWRNALVQLLPAPGIGLRR